jgi:hypothetical protein
MRRTINRVDTIGQGVQGQKPITGTATLREAWSDFISVYGYPPKQLRVSPKCFNDLRISADKTGYPFDLDVKVDYDFEDDQWMLFNEITEVRAVEAGVIEL